MLRKYSEVHTHTNLQHPGGHHPAHERLDVLLYAFEIGALRQKPLLDGQKALQHPVIAEKVRVGTGSHHGVGFQTIQLHSSLCSQCFPISKTPERNPKTPENWSRKRRLRRRACKASVWDYILCLCPASLENFQAFLPWWLLGSALLCSLLASRVARLYSAQTRFKALPHFSDPTQLPDDC